MAMTSFLKFFINVTIKSQVFTVYVYKSIVNATIHIYKKTLER